MKILLTGASGSIGHALKMLFKHDGEHELLCPSHQDLDLCDFEAVNKYFGLNQPDFVIHAAGRSGWRTETPTNDTFFNNILAFDSLCRAKQFDTKLINFATGAEFSRDRNINPNEKKIPASDPYGASKRIISSLCGQYFGVYNLRLYGIFSYSESDERFIKKSLLNYTNKKPIEIFQDRKFSYFYIKDLYKIIISIINNQVGYNTFDCVYSEELYLSQIAQIINSLGDYEVEIIIKDKTLGFDYCGESMYERYFKNITLEDKFELVGIRNGIKEVYNLLTF